MATMNVLTRFGTWFKRVTAPPPELAPKDILSYVPEIPEEPRVIRTYYLMGVSYTESEWIRIPEDTIREFVGMFNKPDEQLPYTPCVRFCAKTTRGAAYTYTAALYGENTVGTFRIARGKILPGGASRAATDGRTVTFTGVDIAFTAGKHHGLRLSNTSVMITPKGELVAIEA